MEKEKREIRKMLRQVELHRRKLLRARFLELGLTVGQGQPGVLQSLLEKGPQTQKELSDHCLLDVTTMSRTLDKMEEAGLLKRLPDPGCRRCYRIFLTDSGKEKAEEVEHIFQQLDQVMFFQVEAEEREILYRILEKLDGNLQRRAEEGGL